MKQARMQTSKTLTRNVLYKQDTLELLKLAYKDAEVKAKWIQVNIRQRESELKRSSSKSGTRTNTSLTLESLRIQLQQNIIVRRMFVRKIDQEEDKLVTLKKKLSKKK